MPCVIVESLYNLDASKRIKIIIQRYLIIRQKLNMQFLKFLGIRLNRPQVRP